MSVSTSAPAPALDRSALTDAFNDALREVIEMMCGLTVTGPVDHDGEFTAPLTGMIGLAGAEFRGLLRISCDLPGARALAAALLGGEEMLGEGNDMVHDGLGELANMLGGAFKQRIDAAGVQIDLSLPSVVDREGELIDLGADELRRQVWVVEDHYVQTTLMYSRAE
jgi:chemotaxis protein CheX